MIISNPEGVEQFKRSIINLFILKTSNLSITISVSLLIIILFHFSYNAIGQNITRTNPGKQEDGAVMQLPFLENSPTIDGDLTEWKEYAFHDGVWDVYRVRQTAWYQPGRNRLTDHGNEPSPENDLQSRYYMAWDSTYLYLGAEVIDNVNDVTDPEHRDDRWYFKDCICWFIEAPRDTIAESFGQGDNAFCFIADKQKPSYGAWWRHGDETRKFIEEPIPAKALDYEIKMTSKKNGNFILEARINMAMTFAKSDPHWTKPKIGDEYSLEIVHTDPDGGDYGGHLILYGTGDNDGTWKKVILAGPAKPLNRQDK